MIPATQRRIVLRERPTGLLSWDDLEIEEAPVPEMGDGQALVRTELIGADATVRSWLNAGEGYLPAVEIGEVVRASGIGTVVATNTPAFEVGDVAYGLPSLQEYAVCQDDLFWSKLPPVPPREWMGKPSSPAVTGAHRVLVEEHAQFSILNRETLVDTLQDYRALVLAEQAILNPKECAAIRQFVRDGGGLVVTGGTGIRDTDNKPLGDFALADVLGIHRVQSVEARCTFLKATEVRGG